ncbi:hypothetical protein Pcinc_039821 [Petrolisthes cinctipes]|uniref:Uncharacterized protein n=1 Tax=Petrolisthes cinctipes TaxID=88211 RepID=A0AAE1BRL5_PETCI|nr:hypothetical protein Pcinc_039821 [Petrolisthes cinctipes]
MKRWTRKKGRRKQNIKVTTQPSTCIFCNIGAERELELGKLHTDGSHTVHYYCLLFSSGLPQNGDDEEGIMGFLPADIEKELHRGRKLKCCYCCRKGATIGCAEKMCRRTYHYSCGAKQYAAFRFSDDFRSYCRAHHTYPQELKSRLTEGAECMICMDAMPRDLRSVVYASCCGAFLHKLCVQQLALSAGYFFKCPLCNDKETFLQEMQYLGIYVPEQDASWELEPNAFSDLLERPVHCDAVPCKCPDGPKMDEDGTRWEILLCSLCGSSGVHTACGGVPMSCREWTCPGCAKTLRESVQRMQSEVRQRRLARRNRTIANSLLVKESSLEGGDVYLMKKEDTDRNVSVEDLEAKLHITPNKRKLEAAEISEATPSKLPLVEDEDEERDGRSVFEEEMEEGDIDWEKLHTFSSSINIRELEEAGEEIPLELEQLKNRAINFQERMAALRLTEDDIVKITKESSSARFKENPVSRADVMRFYRYNLPLNRMLEVLDILKAVVALRKAKVAQFKGKNVRKCKRAKGTPNIKETLLKTAVSQSLIHSKRSPQVKGNGVDSLDTQIGNQGSLFPNSNLPSPSRVHPGPVKPVLQEGWTETNIKASMEVMKEESQTVTFPTSPPHTSSTSLSYSSHSSGSIPKPLPKNNKYIRQKLFPEVYPGLPNSSASSFTLRDSIDSREKSRNTFQSSEVKHEKDEEKSRRNLDETDTCSQTSRPATSSKRTPALKTGSEHPTSSKLGATLVTKSISTSTAHYIGCQKRRKLLGVDAGKQLTLPDVIRKYKNQNTDKIEPPAKRQCVFYDTGGSQDSSSDNCHGTPKDFTGMESNNTKYMGSEWVEMKEHQSIFKGSQSMHIVFKGIKSEQTIFERINGHQCFSDKTSSDHDVSFRIESKENVVNSVTREQNVFRVSNIKQSEQSASGGTKGIERLWSMKSITDNSPCSTSHLWCEDKQLNSDVIYDRELTDLEEEGAARTRRLIIDIGPFTGDTLLSFTSTEADYQKIKALEVDLKPALYGMYSETSSEKSQQKQQQQLHEEQHNLEKIQSRVEKSFAGQNCSSSKYLDSLCRPSFVVLQPLQVHYSIASRIIVVTNDVIKVHGKVLYQLHIPSAAQVRKSYLKSLERCSKEEKGESTERRKEG